jgi:hypothetical protein
MLDAIRVDTPRPTVHARNLFHTSAAIYDSWTAYDATALGYFHREKLSADNIEAAQREAISYAAYRVLTSRFEKSPGAPKSLASFDAKMDELGYDRSFTSTSGNSPAALGQRHENLAGHEGEIAIKAWQGHPADPNGIGGVDWILAESWLPYRCQYSALRSRHGLAARPTVQDRSTGGGQAATSEHCAGLFGRL